MPPAATHTAAPSRPLTQRYLSGLEAFTPPSPEISDNQTVTTTPALPSPKEASKAIHNRLSKPAFRQQAFIHISQNFIAANGNRIGANRTFIGANGKRIGANGTFIGANGKCIGANGNFIGANRKCIGANENRIGANEKTARFKQFSTIFTI